MINFKQYFTLNEIFGSFNYQVPDDKEQQLYDFYMLVYLKGRSSFDVKLDRLRQSGDIPGQASAPKPSFTGDMTEEDQVDYMLHEIGSKLFPYLKKNLLGATFYSMCAEFRHALSQNLPTNLLSFVREKLAPEYAELFKKYVARYTTIHSVGDDFVSSPEIRNREYSTSENEASRNDSYKAMIGAIDGDKEKAVRLMKFIFHMRFWHGSYGGPAWGGIADGWLRLNDANSEAKMVIAIDHIYDLQHNTGSVFNKLKSYYKDGGYAWLKRALDHKADIKNPHELIDNISPGFKKLAYRAIKMKTGKTLEDFNKEKSEKAVFTQDDFDGKSKSPFLSPKAVEFKKAKDPIRHDYEILDSNHNLHVSDVAARLAFKYVENFDTKWVKNAIELLEPVMKHYHVDDLQSFSKLVQKVFGNKNTIEHFYEKRFEIMNLSLAENEEAILTNLHSVLGSTLNPYRNECVWMDQIMNQSAVQSGDIKAFVEMKKSCQPSIDDIIFKSNLKHVEEFAELAYKIILVRNILKISPTKNYSINKMLHSFELFNEVEPATGFVKLVRFLFLVGIKTPNNIIAILTTALNSQKFNAEFSSLLASAVKNSGPFFEAFNRENEIQKKWHNAPQRLNSIHVEYKSNPEKAAEIKSFIDNLKLPIPYLNMEKILAVPKDKISKVKEIRTQTGYGLMVSMRLYSYLYVKNNWNY